MTTPPNRYEPRFGPVLRNGKALFRLWAPRQRRVGLQLEQKAYSMQSHGGWHSLSVAADFGARYRFVLEDGMAVPDPASRFQPEDIHGPSELIDPAAYHWRNTGWRGRAWHETVLYELHIGTFTPEGTFSSAARRLGYLKELGVTAIQLMPVADFPGRRNWGYDGVLPFAPDAAYGRPEQLKAFIDEAHGLGLLVLLDVVYNHYGAEGNYLPLYAPIFTERHQTPWGPAINYDDEGSAEIRAFTIENVLYWLEEFRLDGLRFDAVHEIRDAGAFHLLAEIRAAVGSLIRNRPVHLVLENEENGAEWLARSGGGSPAFTAQWNDDVHHGLHVAVTGEDAGYYGDYARRPELLGRALAQGFAFQGETMAYRGSSRGQPSAHLPPDAFVAFLQNHDQIGNRAFGDRIHHRHPLNAVKAAAAAYLLAPQIPMLFQGEEWAASTPFTFFCDVEGDLADAVRQGRRDEFSRFPDYADPQVREAIPDPVSEQTFHSAKLLWPERKITPHADMLGWYRRILSVRAARIVPLIPTFRQAGRYHVGENGIVHVLWQSTNETMLRVVLNLGDRPKLLEEAIKGQPIWTEGRREGATLGAWTVLWTIETPKVAA